MGNYLSDKNIVNKSKPLIWSKFNKWNTGELKLLDTYISKINPLDEKSAEVMFTRQEYQDLLGLKEIRPVQLNNYLKKFIGNTITLKTERGYENYTLFSKATLLKNDFGEWEITIKCADEMKMFFFELKKLGYKSYLLQNTKNLTSKYSIRLYNMLKDKAFGTFRWEVDLSELRELLGATEKLYEKFGEFNRRVLQKAEEEINKHTDIEFSYEKIKRGRLTRGIVFKIKKSEVEDEQLPG